MKEIDFSQIPTPSYVVEERLLKRNLSLLKSIMDQTGCKILLAQKAFSMFYYYPLIGSYLAGTTASSLFEARLGKEEMGGEVHIFNPAYQESEMEQIISLCDHIVFNTPKQWLKYKEVIQKSGKKVSCGLRVNPQYSEIEVDLYNPCAKGSRLGTILDNIQEEDLEGLEGLHFHTMCEQNSDVLVRTLKVVEEKFSFLLKKMKWINFGGGHHITREDYDVESLISSILHMKETYGIEVYLEPGEAIGLNTGYLVTKVLDVCGEHGECAILDTSAECHMPDVLEMPYRPEIIGAGKAGEKAYTYRLGGPTCLAGDVVGEYSFDEPLKEGDILVFCDMSHYSMVKNNTFNGINLPSIVAYTEKEGIVIVKQFGYEDFKMRLS
ncbi:carboxynorspermidine decarboxylase [Lachnoclostridium phytofermentans]|uniref:Carboxynorspermidine decarboxylase n=1 Tax=Lachnoclostridium phytofermentans (strain ATCC 700394 / DSM 18823 / ISDg) TaxID=357809 RepID=A9KQ96_LACP7|nr:carboxynorspermidine decarboxylase [Lachnoclostridium phytofermentans]ABX43408.1 carboxynorspermidine decarboxylase [Lachnoclostridium phytofermentans ISDg]